MSIGLRPAEPGDLDFLAALYADEAVRPFLATGGRYERSGIAEQLELDPEEGGLLVVELDEGRAGAMFWERTNVRSRIAHVSGIAIHPDFRGRRLADDAARLLQHHLIRERGFHRLELEIYGATILDEKITAATLVGLVLILGGVALASGAVRLPRRATVPARP